MSRLLRANFVRLFKNRVFQVMMLLSVGLGVGFPLKRYYDMLKSPAYYAALPDNYKCTEGFAFSTALYIMFFVTLVVGSYVGTEYSDGTIRNKILTGHQRGAIYLANLITCASAALLLMLSALACMFAVGKLVFTVSIMGPGEILVCILCECLTMISAATLMVLITMLMPNKAAGSVLVLWMVILLFCAGMVIQDRLHQPEYYSGYEIAGMDEEGNPLMGQSYEKNPHYLEGTGRKVYEFLYDALPVCQILQISYEEYGRMNMMALYACLIGITATGTGLVIFGKKDLK